MSEIMLEFRKIFLAEHLCFSLVMTPTHAGGFYTIRFVYAMPL